MSRNLRRGSKRRSLTAFGAGRRELNMAVVKYFSAASGSGDFALDLRVNRKGYYHRDIVRSTC